MATPESLAEMTDASQILKQWEKDQTSPTYDPVPILHRLAEIIELEMENYYKINSDPFDDRNLLNSDQDCISHTIKVLFKKSSFMNKLFFHYLRDNYWLQLGITNRHVEDVNIAACRLMLNIFPRLDPISVFYPTTEILINQLFSWAEESCEPLQSYATGLLASAMKVQDLASNFREKNGKMVPLMLKRLQKLQKEAAKERLANACQNFSYSGLNNRSNSDLPDTEKKMYLKKRKLRDKKRQNGSLTKKFQELNYSSSNSESEDENTFENSLLPSKKSKYEREQDKPGGNGILLSEPTFSRTTISMPKKNAKVSLNAILSKQNNKEAKGNSTGLEEHSKPCLAETHTNVPNIQIYPPTLATKQIFIVRYLTPMGFTQEFLNHVVEHNVLELLFDYINISKTDSQLVCDALKYLASLLSHKKFLMEFISIGGLQRLLDVPKSSVAASGVCICLLCLAHYEDAMEKACVLPKNVITDLVTYTLWLMEEGYVSGRCYAIMFFSLSFAFRVILDEFDAQDGLKKFINMMSRLSLLNIDNQLFFTEEEELAARQIFRVVTIALKKYMEAHLYWKVERLQRIENARNEHEFFQLSLPSYKACKLNFEEVQEKIEMLQKMMNISSSWPPVEQLHSLGGTHCMFKILGLLREWSAAGRLTNLTGETVHACLDVIGICSVVPKVMLLLCEHVGMPGTTISNAVNLLAAAECEIIQDPDVQRAALYTLINCVCAPTSITENNPARYSATDSAKNQTSWQSKAEIMQQIWECVQSNNGIMILLQLMKIRVPITDADSIRALACRALAGLARSEKVKQIISKLPMFTEGQIHALIKDPILQEKRQEHVMFQKYALKLIECVSGKTKPIFTKHEVSSASIHKANVVAQTKIQYNKQQLFQLIQQHLLSEGLTETAATLQTEANLDTSTTVLKSSTHNLKKSISTSPSSGFSPVASTNLYKTKCRLKDATLTGANTTPTTSFRCVVHTSAVACVNKHSDSLRLDDSLNQSLFSNNLTSPEKMSDEQQQQQQLLTNQTSINVDTSPSKSQQASCRSQMKQVSRDSIIGAPVVGIPPVNSNAITLDSIVTGYLTNQHALCKNPMATCPQFNLFEHHRCPDPYKKNTAPINITMRLSRRPFGFDSRRLDKRFIYSRFCPVRSFRPLSADTDFSCCTFSPCQRYLFLGTNGGGVHMFNTVTGVSEKTHNCHKSYLSNISCNDRGDLLLTSSAWEAPLSALWALESGFKVKLQMGKESYAEFSKQQDKIIATANLEAVIYDINTGTKVSTFSSRISNRYDNNKATFSMNDELLLSDGILWDVSSGKEIHKFDKLNKTLSGVFHPNGTEIISNSEVWDLRTFNLLKTVPELDQMNVIFSQHNNIMYAFSVDRVNEFETTSFKTFEAFDYSSITTINTNRCIHDLACNKYNTQIALAENYGDFNFMQKSYVRLYDVGKSKDDESEIVKDESQRGDVNTSSDYYDDDDDDDDEDDDDDSVVSEEPNEDDNDGNSDANLSASELRFPGSSSDEFDSYSDVDFFLF